MNKPPGPGSPPVRIVGRYALYGTLASGGMATVHFGRLLGPVGFSRTVAIKRLHPQFAADPEFVSMFLDEARLAARIRHPNVVPTLDVVANDGELFLVMDYVPGESLARLLRGAAAEGRRIPVPITVAIMSGVLQGLHAAHEAKNERGAPLGIVHRDVSPQNILVGSDGQARVLDFGVAKAAGRMQTTREGQLKGKLSYMAPEQLRGEAISRCTDIYAASVCLWEALTSERLFKGDNEGAVVTRILDGVVPPPSQSVIEKGKTLDGPMWDALQRIDSITKRGLERDPAKRFATAREMASALEKAITPATAAQVSEWVEHIASQVLTIRAGVVAEIESSSSEVIMPAQLEAALGSRPEIPVDEGPPMRPDEVETISAARSSPDGARPFSTKSPPIGSGVSSISVSASAAATAHAARKRRGVFAVVASFGLAAGIGVLVLLGVRNGARDNVAAGAGGSAGATGEASRGPGAGPSAGPSGSASESPPAPGEDAAVVAASASASTPPAPLPARPPQRRTTGPSRPPSPAQPSPASADCNPPFFYDAEGKKHWKANCL